LTTTTTTTTITPVIVTYTAPPKGDSASVSGPPSNGIYAWFRSDLANATAWPSAVGSIVAQFTPGVSIVVNDTCGNYVCASYIAGNYTVGVTFGAILPDTWALCSVTKYNGNNKGRILNSASQNWLFGHWNQQVGVQYQNGWNTPSGSTSVSWPWLVMCGSSSGSYTYVDFGTYVGGNSGKTFMSGTTVGTVVGNLLGGEVSDWAIMELVTWSRELTVSEIITTMAYLNGKTTGYVANWNTTFPWWRCVSLPISANASTLMTFDNYTYTPSFAAGNGFYPLISTSDGSVTVQVKVCALMTPGPAGQGECMPDQNNPTANVVRGIAISGAFLKGNVLVVYANTADGGVMWNGLSQSFAFSNQFVNLSFNDTSTNSWVLAQFPGLSLRVWNRGPVAGYAYLTFDIWMPQPKSTLNGLCGNWNNNANDDVVAQVLIGWASASNLFMTSLQNGSSAVVGWTGPAAVPGNGLYAWFRNDVANSTMWPSIVGPFVATYHLNSFISLSGSASVSIVVGAVCDNYVCGNYLTANQTTGINFGLILSTSWTVCSVSKYNGNNKGRIIASQNGQWLFGHWNQQVGVQYQNGWNTNTGSTAVSWPWLVMCGSSSGLREYVDFGTYVGNGARVTLSGPSVGTVVGNPLGGEVSDWAIMELITWDRELAPSEIVSTMAYLNGKTLGYVASSTTTFPWWRCAWEPLASGNISRLMTFDNATRSPVLNVGAGFYPLINTADGSIILQVKLCSIFSPGIIGQGTCASDPSNVNSNVVRGIAIGGSFFKTTRSLCMRMQLTEA